jgi:hypothetical protein
MGPAKPKPPVLLGGGGSITQAPRDLTSARSEISFNSSAKGISKPRGQTIKNFIAKPYSKIDFYF